MNKATLKKQMQQYNAPADNSKEKYVGVEIEFSCAWPVEEAMEKLIEEGLAKYTTIGYDGEPPRGHIGYEWKLLVPQSEINTVLPAMGRLINSIGGMSNRTCGLHVHLDMRNRNPAKCYNNLVRAQKILFGVAHPRRSQSHWCLPQATADIKAAVKGKSAAINPHLADKKNTIEVRIREGIVDGEDMLRWSRLLIAIADNKLMDKDIHNVKDLESNVRLSRYVKEYVKHKIARNKRTDLLKETA